MSKTILVIDDDPMIRTLVSTLLSREHYTVFTAPDGPAGIDAYQMEKPDLVVVDVAMPGMSGFEVASRVREIQSSEQRPYTPIIILTAYARSFIQSTPEDGRVDSYLTKPVTPEELLKHIRRFLDD